MTPDLARRRRKRLALDQGLDNPAVPGAVAYYDRLLDRMEAALVETEWLADDSYSLADVAMTPYVVRLEHLSMTAMIRQRPKVAAWLSAVQGAGELRRNCRSPGRVLCNPDGGKRRRGLVTARRYAGCGLKTSPESRFATNYTWLNGLCFGGRSRLSRWKPRRQVCRAIFRYPNNCSPTPVDVSYDLDDALNAVVGLQAHIPEGTFTAGILGDRARRACGRHPRNRAGGDHRLSRGRGRAYLAAHQRRADRAGGSPPLRF